MELWTEVRRRALTGQLSKRAACREYDLHWKTLEKNLGHTEPPGYRRAKPRQRPRMERFLPIIFEILEADQRAPKKQRHTAQRIYDRLREEHGFDGKEKGTFYFSRFFRGCPRGRIDASRPRQAPSIK